MKNLAIALASTVALFATLQASPLPATLSGLALIAPAMARDYTGDLLCNLTDTRGNRITYGFGNNSHNADGTLGGTFVETGFEKNGALTTYPTGARPVWLYTANQFDALTVVSRNAPSWRVVMGRITENNGILGAPAVLIDGTTPKARGACYRRTMDTGATVGDLATN